MISQARLRELFDYRADGVLIWRASKGAAKGGTEAGCLTARRGADSYRQVRVDGVLYRAARLVFLWHHGYMPQIVDHRDTDVRNDRIENLRPADPYQNQWNRRRPAKGVSFSESRNRWRVQIMARGKRYFAEFESRADTERDAADARARMHAW